MKQTIIGCLAALAVVILLGWFLLANDLLQYKFFAPRQEAIRRQTFEQSKAYNQGMIQNLEKEHIEYVRTKDPEARAAIASVVLHDFADYPEDQLPADLATWLDQLKNQAQSQ